MSPIAALAIRPIGPGDRDALVAAFERLSDESRYRRFLAPKPRLSEREVEYLTEVDHVTHEALVAVAPGNELVGVARYAPWPGRSGVAELAVTIADEWHGRGLGTLLAQRAVESAKANGMTVLTGSTLWENQPARRLLARLGFRPTGSEGGVVDFRLELGCDAAVAA